MNDSQRIAKNKSRSALPMLQLQFHPFPTVSFPSYCATLQHPHLPLSRPAIPGNSRCRSLQFCGFLCLPGVKAGLKSARLIPAVSKGCVCAVQWLFAQPVGLGWLGQGKQVLEMLLHSALDLSLKVGRLWPVCVALPQISVQILGAEDIVQHDRGGRREALSTLAWFQAKLLTSPTARKSSAGGLLQKLASPGMLMCCRFGI